MQVTVNEFLKDMKKKPMGLFQTYAAFGLIFPIKMENNVATYTMVPVYNDCRGENIALTIMEEENFILWAIDPWSGEVHLDFSK